jgi:hypothetical protein
MALEAVPVCLHSTLNLSILYGRSEVFASVRILIDNLLCSDTVKICNLVNTEDGSSRFLRNIGIVTYRTKILVPVWVETVNDVTL